MKPVPEKATVDGIEGPLVDEWQKSGIYEYDKQSLSPVFSIDTPPPTVSGSLHVGHVFSYTHTDLIARYKRMRGFNVFYPMGFDDNGLPTERRVQNYFGVRPDLEASYDPNFVPRQAGGEGKSAKASDQTPVSRQNFIELCEQLSTDDEVKFKELWQRLGISVDWNQTYQTIDERSRRAAQLAFLNNLERGEAYISQAPVQWDYVFQTAVAQAEVEAREYPGFYHNITFSAGSELLTIATTRPELLISCCALIVNPEDDRYKHLIGKTATSPIFEVEVPILAHHLAEIDKGTGIVMCCTFGDQVDVQWWRELKLPLRSVMSKNGRLDVSEVDWVTSDFGKQVLQEISWKTSHSAREIVVKYLREAGRLVGELQPTVRMTNFFEKGDKPLEIITSKQWYIKNGGKDEELRSGLLKAGENLNFVPDFMRVRFNNWVEGLSNDWLVSRQRFFGVAFPIWYKLDEHGEIQVDQILTPHPDRLPLDPTIDTPEGFDESQRDVPNGFTAEQDVMDTWATSSLTPQIACGWCVSPEQNSATPKKTDASDFAKLYPMSLRPQGQDIIRTWLFSTLLRAHLESGELPWSNAAISGWILDPDRKKMSKSKGNVVVPTEPIDVYGADAVRYWAAGAKLGTDATYKEEQMKIGRRLAMKILNVSKFVLGMQENIGSDIDLKKITYPLDISIIAQLNDVITRATDAFEKYDHNAALEVSEQFFWEFCDDYVEIVKRRAYNQDAAFSQELQDSARTTLQLILTQLLKLLAPFIPFATEEAYSWFNDSSVHISAWPTSLEFSATCDAALWNAATKALEVLRRVKSEAKISMKVPLKTCTITAPDAQVDLIAKVATDLKVSMNILELDIVPGEEFQVLDFGVVE
jgi:valyl-tRNA synthetase